MIDTEELTRAGAGLDDRFGAEAATRFGVELPGRLAVLIGEWGIEVDGLVDTGASAVVLAARLATGEPAVVKLSPDTDALAHRRADRDPRPHAQRTHASRRRGATRHRHGRRHARLAGRGLRTDRCRSRVAGPASGALTGRPGLPRGDCAAQPTKAA